MPRLMIGAGIQPHPADVVGAVAVGQHELDASDIERCRLQY